MPNWCCNKLYLTGTAVEIDRLLATVRGEESLLDFEKIIPMPGALNVDAGAKSDVALAVAKGDVNKQLQYPWAKWKGITDVAGLCAYFGSSYEQMFAFGQELLENIQLYGHPTWLEWSFKHWGTHWNVDGKDDVQLELKSPTLAILHFDTAWDPPVPAISKLAKMFPMVEMRLEYCEPNMGFAGELALAGGVEIFHRRQVIEDFDDDADQAPLNPDPIH